MSHGPVSTDGVLGCQGKHRFDSRVMADRVAVASRRRRDSAMHAYRCKHCNGWHLGSNKSINKRPRQQRQGEAL